jgi:hypothetical protein
MRKIAMIVSMLAVLGTSAQAGYNYNDSYYVIKPYSNKATYQ